MAKVTVFAESFYKSECMEEANKILDQLIAKTHAEKGCIRYDLYRDKSDPTHTMYFEEWESQADLDAHAKSAHMAELLPLLRALRVDGKQGAFMVSDTLF